MNDLVPIVVPRENVNDETVTIVAWYVSTGERVDRGQSIAQIETSKAVLDIEAPIAGTLRNTVAVGEEVPIGSTIGRIELAKTPDQYDGRNGSAHSSSAATEVHPHVSGPAAIVMHLDATVDQVAVNDSDGRVHPRGTRFSPQARQLIQMLGLDPASFVNQGLVRTSDIHRVSAVNREQAPTQVSPERGNADSRDRPGTIAVEGVSVRSELLPKRKRTETKYLRSSSLRCVTSTVTIVCPTRGLRGLARQVTPSQQGVATILVFEVARLLRKYPALNSYVEGDNVNYFDDVNVGYALNAGRGLKVPIVHHADRKGLAEVGTELNELLVNYLGDGLSPESLSGGTFTVTDLSGEDVLFFHPLINHAQSAILGIGSETFAPGSKDGVFHLILSFDHQIVDGQVAARFLNDLKRRLAFHEQTFLEDDRGGSLSSDAPRCSRCQATVSDLDPYGQYLISTVRAEGMTRLICTNCLRGY